MFRIITLSLFISSMAFAGPITVKHSGKVIDIPRWNPVPGTAIGQWSPNASPFNLNQLFEVNSEEGGYVTIFSPLTRQCLDVANASKEGGTAVVQWFCHKQDHQLWRVDRQSDGYVHFVSKNSGKCLAVKDARRDDGAPLVQADCGAGDEQKFRY
jgi:hypothetical protein